MPEGMIRLCSWCCCISLHRWRCELLSCWLNYLIYCFCYYCVSGCHDHKANSSSTLKKLNHYCIGAAVCRCVFIENSGGDLHLTISCFQGEPPALSAWRLWRGPGSRWLRRWRLWPWQVGCSVCNNNQLSSLQWWIQSFSRKASVSSDKIQI